ncbi:hypothetical protein [Nocardia sp. NPDC059239]|uniref:hypothetical protein n=1 Tax=unclassified Nocardia TaxID=2637762 RepID=UPI0036C4F6B7
MAHSEADAVGTVPSTRTTPTRGLLPLLFAGNAAMYAPYIGVGSVLLPLQIEHIDAASKVANLGLVVASAVVCFGGYPPLFLVGGLLSVLGAAAVVPIRAVR